MAVQKCYDPDRNNIDDGLACIYLSMVTNTMQHPMMLPIEDSYVLQFKDVPGPYAIYGLDSQQLS